MKKSKAREEIQSIQRKAIYALKKAVSNAIEEHRQTGDRIAIWSGGKVVKVPAKRLR